MFVVKYSFVKIIMRFDKLLLVDSRINPEMHAR